MTIPLAALSTWIVLTYCPVIYKFLPFLGTFKIVLVAGIVLLISFGGTTSKYTNSTAHTYSVVYIWVGFLALMTMGLLVSIDRGTTFEFIERSVKFFLIFLVMIKIVDTTKRLEIVFATFVLSGTCMASGAIYNFFVNPDVLNVEGTARLTGGFRAIAVEQGIFADPNDLALLLNSVLPFALYFIVASNRKVLPFVAVVLLVIGIMASQSRAGFLGLCVTGLCYMVFFLREKKGQVFVLLAVALSLWVLAPDSYKARVGTIVDWQVDASGKTGTRMDGWLIALQEGLDHPFLGVGAGVSGYVMGIASHDWVQVHNAFVQVFLEVGTFGFIAYMLLFVTSVNRLRSQSECSSRTRSCLKIIMMAFFSYGVCIFFTPQAYSPILYTLTAFAVIVSELMRKELNNIRMVQAEMSPFQSSVRNMKPQWS